MLAQRDVAELRPRAAIGVGRRKRIFAQSEHNQRRVHVGLKAEVAMHILGQFARAADEARRRIEREPRSRARAALAVQPFSIVGEEALSPRGHGVALIDHLDPVGDVNPQELAEIGADQIARCLATEHRCWRELLPRYERFRECAHIDDGRCNERVCFVFAKRYVPGQGQPVNLCHLGCHEAAGKGWRRIEASRCAVQAS